MHLCTLAGLAFFYKRFTADQQQRGFDKFTQIFSYTWILHSAGVMNRQIVLQVKSRLKEEIKSDIRFIRSMGIDDGVKSDLKVLEAIRSLILQERLHSACPIYFKSKNQHCNNITIVTVFKGCLAFLPGVDYCPWVNF